jgi:hypothetical protein
VIPPYQPKRETSVINWRPRVEGTLYMLQWNARLFVVLAFAVMVAAMIGCGLGDGVQLGW